MRRDRLSRREFDEAVREAVETLPEPFRRYLRNVAVDVQDEPDPEDWSRLHDRDDPAREASMLLGLFVGVPLTEQEYATAAPNRIKIFQRPMEQVSRNREDLLCNIRDTVLHEIGHHFGLTEEEIEALEQLREENRRRAR